MKVRNFALHASLQYSYLKSKSSRVFFCFFFLFFFFFFFVLRAAAKAQQDLIYEMGTCSKLALS